MSIQEELARWAGSVGLPHVLAAEGLEDRQDRLAVLLVGSVATGFCREGCDVDIALLCDGPTYERLSPGKTWSQGRPSEIRVHGQQLHYYAEAFDSVLAKVAALDDGTFYTYGMAKVLLDPARQFNAVIVPAIRQPGLRKERLEGKLDVLRRRSKALAGAAKEQANALVLSKMSLEIVSLSLKVIALLGDVPFDPRKRLLETALVGPLGEELGAVVGELIQSASQWRRGQGAFLERAGHVTSRLSQVAGDSGFAVGLPAPDPRAQERL